MKNILIIILLITQIVSTIFVCFSVKHFVKLHSVHPEFGEYEQKVYNCYPWDSCTKPLMKKQKYCFLKKFLYTDVKEL